MRLLNIFIISLLIFSCDLLTSPDNKKNSEISDAKDWEGHFPDYNVAYEDSILFNSSRHLGTAYSPGVYIIHKNGGKMRCLTPEWFAFGASFSPRRWKIIFLMEAPQLNRNVQYLYMMDCTGANKKQITPANERVWGASWSPDGQTIAYIELDTLSQYGEGRIKTIAPDGSSPKILTEWFHNLNRVTWSNDSKFIAYTGWEPGKRPELYIVTAGGERYKEFDFGKFIQPFSASWSPARDEIAFSSSTSVGSHIFVFNLTTETLKQLTRGETLEYYPSWSGDGNQIVFCSQKFGDSPDALFIVNRDGSNLKRLTDDDGVDYNPSWFK